MKVKLNKNNIEYSKKFVNEMIYKITHMNFILKNQCKKFYAYLNEIPNLLTSVEMAFRAVWIFDIKAEMPSSLSSHCSSKMMYFESVIPNFNDILFVIFFLTFSTDLCRKLFKIDYLMQKFIMCKKNF